jgi:hypothetical protein
MAVDLVASSLETTGFHPSFQNPDVASKSLHECAYVLVVPFILGLFCLQRSNLRKYHSIET